MHIDKEFDEFVTQPGMDCFIQWNYASWEVRITKTSPYGDWSVFKEHEEREKAMCMALVEAKRK